MQLPAGELAARLYIHISTASGKKELAFMYLHLKGQNGKPVRRRKGIFKEGIGAFVCAIEQGAWREGGVSLCSNTSMKEVD